jgi:hypothetical protein
VGDEPVLLFVYAVEKKHAIVGKIDSSRTIGIPIGQVYMFDMSKFSTARTAYESGEREELVEICRSLLDEFTCNRYQDNLESLHDKEILTDTEGVASGGE